jgi:uncharacterized membrane protein YdfJ with MMPL/SSD domain
MLRKNVNAHRRRYQRTKGSTVLREQMKEHYRTVKDESAQTIKKEKYESWKKFCTLTPANNLWTVIYRIAASKRKQIQLTTTLRKKNGTMTKDLQETKYTLENITAEANQTNGNATHKEIRALIQEKIDFNEDKGFTLSEIKTAVASMKE